MKEFSIPMALVDFIPVILFLLATEILIKDLKGRINKFSFIIFAAGAFLVTSAGTLKALYKLLYAMNIGDFT
ncbi:MAG: hypothetical protein IJI05_03700, partial [Erysipelotrichaceae bacterium]|nr:hypothetical protein [Erysipelotrichaceae bacterium]